MIGTQNIPVLPWPFSVAVTEYLKLDVLCLLRFSILEARKSKTGQLYLVRASQYFDAWWEMEGLESTKECRHFLTPYSLYMDSVSGNKGLIPHSLVLS